MKKNFIFRSGDGELILPVTPSSFRMGAGIQIETVNLTNIGDYIIGGHGTLAAVTIESFFPRFENGYEYALNTFTDPYQYVNWFRVRSWYKTVVRFIISETDVNIPVLIENIEYGEQDGTGDVYYTLTLRQYREVSAVSGDVSARPERPNEAVQSQENVEVYTIKSGDTLSAICRRHYGNANLWGKLQQYNGLKSTLIIAGRTLKLPPISVLEGLA